MKQELEALYIDQLEKIINLAGADRSLHDASNSEQRKISVMSVAAIERISGVSSAYSRLAQEAIASTSNLGYQAIQVKGIVQGLLEDIRSGYLKTIEELIHGNLFGDFLEMAVHLIDEGYKDAAAVIAGSSLEAHLRRMCIKAGIGTEYTSPSGAIKPKNGGQMNSELAKAGAYDKDKLDQKSVTAWLDLRNKAAHGRYDEYEKGQVSLMIDGIRDFILRNPA